MKRFHPESCNSTIELLLLASRLSLSKPETERLSQFDFQKIDWKHFFELALFHRVYALVYRNLSRLNPEIIPESIQADFSEKIAQNQVRILEMTAELVRIAEAFDQQKIPLLPLKGPALAASVYNDLTLRPAGDLDLLIHPKDISKSLEILRHFGFSVVLREPGAFATPLQEAAVSRYLYHFILFDEDREMVVELHFSLSPKKLPFHTSTTELFNRISHIPIGGKNIAIPHPIDNLIYLSLHGGKHAWSRLEWLVGIAELTKQMNLPP